MPGSPPSGMTLCRHDERIAGGRYVAAGETSLEELARVLR
jgi:hypothetical protein